MTITGDDLGFSGPPADTRIVVAMSGGVDSSVTAALLKERGYDVVGITLQLYDHGEVIQKKGACCAGQDIYDARQVADRIGIPHYVLDYESRFKQQVIEEFADSYARGETPIPCVRCNQTVKFRDLLQTARELGAAALATGHYLQRKAGPDGRAELHRAADPSRDQSYFLFATTQEQADFLRFPLGGMPKTETRALAERFALPVAEKPDSQDICFVPTGSYASIVERLRPEAGEPGEIVHVDGTVMGRHQGIVHYTIGQRKGLGIGGRSAETEPLFVVRLDPGKRQVIVGPRAALGREQVQLADVNWLGEQVPGEDGFAVQVKLRSTMPVVPARLYRQGDGRWTAVLDVPQFGISPGQACVFYDGERLLGGGWIQRDAA